MFKKRLGGSTMKRIYLIPLFALGALVLCGNILFAEKQPPRPGQQELLTLFNTQATRDMLTSMLSDVQKQPNVWMTGGMQQVLNLQSLALQIKMLEKMQKQLGGEKKKEKAGGFKGFAKDILGDVSSNLKTGAQWCTAWAITGLIAYGVTRYTITRFMGIPSFATTEEYTRLYEQNTSILTRGIHDAIKWFFHIPAPSA